LAAGLSVAVASTESLERAASVRDRGFYFDVLQYEKFANMNQTPSTPATSLLYALEAQMGDIGREGIEQRWERHLAMRDVTIDWVESLARRRGFDVSIVAPEGSRSRSVAVSGLPTGRGGAEMSEAVSARGFTIGSGSGKLRESTVRIGHMGAHSVNRVEICLQECEDAIVELAERRRFARV